MLCWKLLCTCAHFACAPEMTTSSEDKTEEAAANLWVCDKFSVTGRAHEQTFACDVFSCYIRTGAPVIQQQHLSHKIQANFLMYTSKQKRSLKNFPQKMWSYGLGLTGFAHQNLFANKGLIVINNVMTCKAAVRTVDLLVHTPSPCENELQTVPPAHSGLPRSVWLNQSDFRCPREVCYRSTELLMFQCNWVPKAKDSSVKRLSQAKYSHEQWPVAVFKRCLEKTETARSLSVKKSNYLEA